MQKKIIKKKKKVKRNENIPIKINTDLKIINFEKEIVKKEMFPLINKDIEKWKEKNFSYEVVQNMNVSSLKEYQKLRKI